MAKKSKIARNKQRQEVVDRYAAKRAELKKALVDPKSTDEEREVVATLQRDHPLETLDAAIEDLVVTVADLADLTRERRYKVETVKREAPKVGRNDPCPCGSGRKYKVCHGAS